MDRQQKKQVVDTLGEEIGKAGTVVVTHYKGLTVADMTALRRKSREAGVTFRVAKNRLVKIALKDTGFDGLSDLFSGPVAVAYSEDVVAPAKVVADFAKENEKLVVIGGGMGDKVLDSAGVMALSKMPSLDELRAKIIGMLNTPATRIASVVQAPGGQVARVINAYATKG